MIGYKVLGIICSIILHPTEESGKIYLVKFIEKRM